MNMRDDARDYIQKHIAQAQEEFFQLLRIESISTDKAYTKEVREAADWIVARMQAMGLQRVEATETGGHPMVCGEWMGAGEKKPTVLFYAHYDVQPAEPLDLWESPPFSPTIRDGKLYARGVVDDKIGVFACLKAAEAFLATAGSLPLNVRFLFEGEEETGSPSVDRFIREHSERIAGDYIVICDGSGPPDFPSIIYSCRGIVGAEVTVKGPGQDMHSGSVGGLVENPIHTVSRIIASFHDSEGRILIPGFYENAVQASEEEKKRFANIERQYLRAMKERLGAFSEWGDPDFSPLERLSLRPTCDVNGIYGGYQGDGMKTIIPAHARCKVTMRLAPGQDPAAIADNFVRHVEGFASDTVDVTAKIEKSAWPATSNLESPEIRALERACESSWGEAPIYSRTGGSVPVAGLLQRATGIQPVFLAPGIGGLVHSPNEFMHLDFFSTGIDMVTDFLAELGNM